MLTLIDRIRELEKKASLQGLEIQLLNDEINTPEPATCDLCGGNLDDNGYCSYPCENCD